jgi:hypothetical protein
MDMFRVIKIRSLENAVYNTQYNRATWQIMPDNMSTDLSESYIALKVNVVNGNTGNPFSNTEIAKLDASQIMFSFGDSVGELYSPACLIKVARLFQMGNQTEILEEIQFSNVLSQALKQIASDFETVASESLLTLGSSGMLCNGSLATSTSSYFGASVSLSDPSVQVNIKLSELFGLCRSKNFWNMNGLQIQLELEPTKSLITQSCVVNLMNPLPTILPGPVTGYVPKDPSTNNKGTRCIGQNLYSPTSNEMASLTNLSSGLISTPKSYVYDTDYFLPVTSNFNSIEIKPAFPWTVANMASLLIQKSNVSTNVVASVIKVVFRLTQNGHQDRFFERISTVTNIVPASVGVNAEIVLNDYFVFPDFAGTYLAGTVITLDRFEVLMNAIEPVSLTKVQYDSLVSNNTILLSDDAVANLQKLGALSAGTIAQIDAGTISKLTGSNVMFNLNVGMENQDGDSDENVVYIYPDEYISADVPSLRQLYSNQTKQMPTQQGLVRCVKAVKASASTFTVTFQTMGLENNNSLQNKYLKAPGTPAAPTAGLGSKAEPTGFLLNITNVKIPKVTNASNMILGQWYQIVDLGDGGAGWQTAGADAGAVAGSSFRCVALLAGSTGTVTWCQPNRSSTSYEQLTWQITKAEVVLVQYEKDPSMPPIPVYSTYKCEVATIENNLLDQYNRQFIVQDQNCYNAILCTPNYNADSDDLYPESLISKSRNINRYRWSLNNIDNTNRDIVIKNNTSSYPSSLHVDKLMDCIKNGVGGLKSLSGVNGVARSVDPTVVFPLKIYTSSDAESNYMNPMSGYTLQFSAYGDSTHNMYITPGAIFLFKECFKMLPTVPFTMA